MTSFFLNIDSWFALAPGLTTSEEWLSWAKGVDDSRPTGIIKCKKIPMMAARRMSPMSRLAVECGLNLLEKQPDGIVCISRHGELARTYNVLCNIANNIDVSPTDFAMAVHNTAAGLLTITGQSRLPVTSLAAGRDGFQQGLFEVLAMFAGGAKRVLLIDFDDELPDFYRVFVSTSEPVYAVGFILTPDPVWCCESYNNYCKKGHEDDEILPQSLCFLKNWLQQLSQFVIEGNAYSWQWKQQNI